jgi:acetoin utilization protein AcuB
MLKHDHPDSEAALKRLTEESSTCERWMTTKLFTVQPSDSIAYAREQLRLHRINQLPVVGNGKLLGIVTDRDLRDQAGKSVGLAIADVASPEDVQVRVVMTHPVIALGPHSTLVNAAEIMRATRIGAVPIVSGDSLVGIITRSDILEAFVAYANGRYERSAPRLGDAAGR